MAILSLTRCTTLIAIALGLGAAAPASAQNYDGSGLLRVGAFVQGSWIDGDFRVTALGPPVTTTNGSGSLDGFGGGISFGYDHRFGSMILGVEADASIDSASKRIGTVDFGADYFVTFRGRLGFNLQPGLLVYATTGWALLGAEAETTIAGVSSKVPDTLSGWTVGGGIEIDWHHVTLFAEYLHTDFGAKTFDFTGGNLRIDASDDTVRLGVKFKYGYDHTHDRDYRGPAK